MGATRSVKSNLTVRVCEKWVCEKSSQPDCTGLNGSRTVSAIMCAGRPRGARH